MISIKKLISEVQDLAPLPGVILELVRISRQNDPDILEAIEVIKYDQALTTRVLRYANSPMANARYKVQNVKDAAIRLGFGTLLEISIGAEIHTFMIGSLPQYGLAEEELWLHSKVSAFAAEVIQRNLKRKLPPTAFTAVLLHDIGKLVLARHLDKDTANTINQLSVGSTLTFYQAEHDVLGYTHADVGSYLAKHWNLGSSIADAIANHHNVTTDHGPVCDAVHVCNVISKTIGCGLGLEGMNLSANTAACERLGLKQDLFEHTTAEVAAFLPNLMTGTD